MLIELTQGKFCIIDDEDYHLIKKYKWHSSVKKNRKYSNYAVTSARDGKKQTTITMSRLIMDLPKNKQIDHINGDTLDNRKSNLRICSIRENILNRRKFKTGKTSKYIGVYFHKGKNKFIGQVQNYGKMFSKAFKNEEDAAKWRDLIVKKYFGEYAVLNFK